MVIKETCRTTSSNEAVTAPRQASLATCSTGVAGGSTEAPERTTKAPKRGKEQLPPPMSLPSAHSSNARSVATPDGELEHLTRQQVVDLEIRKDLDRPEPPQAASSRKARKNNKKDLLAVEPSRIKCAECGGEDDVIITTFRYPLNCSLCVDDTAEGRLCMRCRFFECLNCVACEGERPEH